MKKSISLILAAAAAATFLAPATSRGQNATGESSILLELEEVEKLLKTLPNLEGKSEEELEKIFAAHPEYARSIDAAEKKAREALSKAGGEINLDSLEEALKDLNAIEELQGKSEEETAQILNTDSKVRRRVSAAGRRIAVATGAASDEAPEEAAPANAVETALASDDIGDAVQLPDGTSTNVIDDVFFGEFHWDFGGFNGQKAEKTNVEIAGLGMKRDGLSFKYVRDLSEWGLSHEDYTQALACLFVCDNDGRWIGGKFDWISSSRKTRDFKNIYSGYEGWSLRNVPNPCTAAFVIVSKDGRKRSNVITAMWER